MQKLAAALPDFFKTIRDDSRRIVFLREFWPRIVGEELATNAAPKQLAAGSLTLAVQDSIWLHQLGEMEEMIRNSVNRFWGQRLVERIILEVDPY